MLTVLNKTFHLERVDRMLGLHVIRPHGCMMKPVASLFFRKDPKRPTHKSDFGTIKMNILKLWNH